MGFWQLAVEDYAAINDVVSVLSILSAAGFGALALFTQYRDKKGKITRYGKLATAGIALSAMFSLASHLATGKAGELKDDQARRDHNNELAASKAERDALMKALRGQSEDLGTQLAKLEDLRANMETVQNQGKLLTASSAAISFAQRRSLAASLGNLTLTSASIGESREKFATLLEQQWQLNSRVELRDIFVSVRFTCDTQGDRASPGFRFFDKGMNARIRLFKPGADGIFDQPLKHFDSGLVLSDQAVTLTSPTQSISSQYVAGIPEGNYEGMLFQANTIGPFIGDIGRFGTTDHWRDALIELEIFSDDEELDDQLGGLGIRITEDTESLASFFDSGLNGRIDAHRRRFDSIEVVEGCSVGIDYFVGGTKVGSTSSMLTKTWFANERKPTGFFLKTPIVRIAPTVFPSRAPG